MLRRAWRYRFAVAADVVMIVFLREVALQILREFLIHCMGEEAVGEMLCACDFGEEQGAFLHFAEADIVAKEAMFRIGGAVLQRAAVGSRSRPHGKCGSFLEASRLVAADVLDALGSGIYVADSALVGGKCEEDMIGVLVDFAACCQGLAIVDDSGEDEGKERGKERVAREICAALR